MVCECPHVRGDNPRALASRLYPVQVDTPQHTYISGDMTHYEMFYAKVGKACADPESYARGGQTLITFFRCCFFFREERGSK